jgi:hypothetical protein
MAVLSRAWPGLGVILALLLPTAAWACPYCAVQDQAGMAGTVLLGAMIVVPFLIVATVFPALRRAAAADHGLSPTDTE